MGMGFISFDNVSYKSGDKDILKDISIDFQSKCITTIIGPSGAGKSTMIKLINRLIDPTEGNIYLDGTNINTLDIIKLRRRIGMVFQQAYLFSGTVSDNIRYGPLLKGIKDIDVAHFLNIVGLDKNYLNRGVGELSGGEQQRVSIARTLANSPEVILLDEPTSALDPAATQVIEDLILKLKREFNITFIWITHNMEQVRRVGDYTILLVDGRVVEYNNTKEFFERPVQETTKLFIEGKLEGGISR